MWVFVGGRGGGGKYRDLPANRFCLPLHFVEFSKTSIMPNALNTSPHYNIDNQFLISELHSTLTLIVDIYSGVRGIIMIVIFALFTNNHLEHLQACPKSDQRKVKLTLYRIIMKWTGLREVFERRADLGRSRASGSIFTKITIQKS